MLIEQRMELDLIVDDCSICAGVGLPQHADRKIADANFEGIAFLLLQHQPVKSGLKLPVFGRPVNEQEINWPTKLINRLCDTFRKPGLPDIRGIDFGHQKKRAARHA